jgi:formylglycine-generating enzyme required for sulfatase activity
VGSVTWPDALEYCNWLSKQAGFPESEYCYPTDRETLQSWIPDREHLERTGFRLPTTEEWILACRSGTTSSRYFGDGNNLIGYYCWFDGNSQTLNPSTQEYDYRLFPVGLRKPNEFGLFDQYGNIVEWCDGVPSNATSERASCGGGTTSTASRIKSDDAASWPTLTNFRSIGFRIARTVRKD